MCRPCPYKSMVSGGSLESLGHLTMHKMLMAGRKMKHRGGNNCERIMHRIGRHSLCIWLIYSHASNRGQAHLPRNNQSITQCLICLSLSFYGKRLEPYTHQLSLLTLPVRARLVLAEEIAYKYCQRAHPLPLTAFHPSIGSL